MEKLEILINQAQEILETLSLSYYLKSSTIKVEFSTTEITSYFSPSEWKIVVAFNNIYDALVNAEANSKEFDMEKTMRCMLYHETSHALLTPKELMETLKSNFSVPNDITNIVEDERIENILKHYYYNVDFRENVKNVAKEVKIKDFTSFVFMSLRFRKSKCQNEVNSLFKEFLNNTKDKNALSSAYNLSYGFYDFICKMKELFDKNYGNNHNNQNQNENGKGAQSNENSQSESQENSSNDNENSQSEENQTEENQTEENNENGNNEENENQTEENSQSEEENQENESEENSQSEEEIEESQEDENGFTSNESKDLVANIVSMLEAEKDRATDYGYSLSNYKPLTNFKLDLIKIITRNIGCGVKSDNNGALSYSGRFSTRAYLKDFNNTKKVFIRNNNLNNLNNNKNCEKVLNIWLDNSGSFKPNDYIINKILATLNAIEKSRKDFKFNLVKINYAFTLLKGDARFSCSGGGNALPKDQIEKIYKEINQTQKEFNIVLFDGQCGYYNSQCRTKNERDMVSYDNLKVFDNKRSVFITEYSNYGAIKSVCANCREVINEDSDYASALIKNITKAFDLLF